MSFSLPVFLHVGDLCNCAIKWELSRAWARRVCDEATAQVQRELAMGIHSGGQATPYSEEELCARQLVFLDGWIRPLLAAAAILYPGARGRLAALRDQGPSIDADSSYSY